MYPIPGGVECVTSCNCLVLVLYNYSSRYSFVSLYWLNSSGMENAKYLNLRVSIVLFLQFCCFVGNPVPGILEYMPSSRQCETCYHMEGNFGGRKIWRIVC